MVKFERDLRPEVLIVLQSFNSEVKVSVKNPRTEDSLLLWKKKLYEFDRVENGTLYYKVKPVRSASLACFQQIVNPKVDEKLMEAVEEKD